VSNRITSNRATGSTPLLMSNGTTSVLLDVLAIAGSDLATTPWEKKLVYWLVQHDQSRSGLGAVSFPLCQGSCRLDRIGVKAVRVARGEE